MRELRFRQTKTTVEENVDFFFLTSNHTSRFSNGNPASDCDRTELAILAFGKAELSEIKTTFSAKLRVYYLQFSRRIAAFKLSAVKWNGNIFRINFPWSASGSKRLRVVCVMDMLTKRVEQTQPWDMRRLAALLTGWGRGRSKVNIQVKSQDWHQRFPRFLANLSPLKMPTPALVSPPSPLLSPDPTDRIFNQVTLQAAVFPLWKAVLPPPFWGGDVNWLFLGPAPLMVSISHATLAAFECPQSCVGNYS